MSKGKPLILCVDDEENPLVLRKMVLQKAGYDVLTARGAKEALAIISSQPIDLVISDHLMPGTTGAELAQQIKTDHPRLPVVLISGLNEVPPGSSMADVFLSKLEGPDHLCREVATLLER
ncbi:MAG: response regulator [Acidobacteriaceae bacterium]|nr:response regulator [Acidobacteriaceae bacterium]